MVTLETGGAQQVGKRRENRLSFLICDSKLDKPVNDLTLKLLRTRVRLPPSPPFWKHMTAFVFTFLLVATLEIVSKNRNSEKDQRKEETQEE